MKRKQYSLLVLALAGAASLTAAFKVYGEIGKKYNSLGGPNGFLGVPLTDETGTPDGVGRYNHFKNGSIYWTPATQAHEVHGAIRDKGPAWVGRGVSSVIRFRMSRVCRMAVDGTAISRAAPCSGRRRPAPMKFTAQSCRNGLLLAEHGGSSDIRWETMWKRRTGAAASSILRAVRFIGPLRPPRTKCMAPFATSGHPYSGSVVCWGIREVTSISRAATGGAISNGDSSSGRPKRVRKFTGLRLSMNRSSN